MNKSFAYWTVGALIAIGFLLTIVSWMNVCTEACGAAHSYKMLGYPFEWYGMLFFPLLGFLHFTSARLLTSMLIAGAVGMEIDFILLQKYVIKAWCPICLSIAATVFLIAGFYAWNYFLNLKGSELMKTVGKGLASLSLIAFGFFFASISIAKVEPLQAMEHSIQENIVFGNPNSRVVVYLFTDWQCPACRKLEPVIEKLVPEISKHAKLVFVDTIIHADTLNYIPYNLSFMINDKPKYLALRHKLTEISMETGSPTDAQVAKAASSLGVQYKQLHYADVEAGIKYFKHLVKHYDIDGTPEMIIVNQKGESNKLGGSQITLENVMKAIEAAQR